MGRLHLGGYESGSDISPLSKSVIVQTLDIDPNRILLGVGSVPSTTGRSVSGILFKGFPLWAGSGPPACCYVFTIFSWKFGIVVVSDNAFQS